MDRTDPLCQRGEILIAGPNETGPAGPSDPALLGGQGTVILPARLGYGYVSLVKVGRRFSPANLVEGSGFRSSRRRQAASEHHASQAGLRHAPGGLFVPTTVDANWASSGPDAAAR